MKVRSKLILGFLIVVLLVGVVGYISLTKVTKIGTAFHRVEEETTPAIVALGDIRSNLFFLLLEANEYILNPVEEHSKEFGEAKEDIRKAVIAYEKAEEEVEAMKKGTEKVIALGEEIIRLKDDGASQEFLLEKSSILDEVAEEFSHEINEEIEHDTADLKKSDMNVHKEMRSTHNLIIILTSFAIFLALGIGIFISSSISKPIQELTKATKEVKKGNLRYKIKIKSKDEIGELAETFDEMRLGLKDRNDLLNSLLKGFKGKVGKIAIILMRKNVHNLTKKNPRIIKIIPKEIARSIKLEQGLKKK